MTSIKNGDNPSKGTIASDIDTREFWKFYLQRQIWFQKILAMTSKSGS